MLGLKGNDMEIRTFDHIDDGAYMGTTRGGVLGMRRRFDRRFWMAWKDTNDTHAIMRGVMDDFGTLVETFW